MRLLEYLIILHTMILMPQIKVYGNVIPSYQENDSTVESTSLKSEIIWKDTVLINDDVEVYSDQNLIINPGTTVMFLGKYSIIVNGRLTSIGNDSSLITFTCIDTIGFYNNNELEGGWNGIHFVSKNYGSFSELQYCIFEFVKNIQNTDNTSGGAIVVNNYNNLSINNCLFRNNKSINGAALMCGKSNITISNSIFQNNTALNRGGAMYFSGSNVNVHNNLVFGNSALYGGGLAFSLCNSSDVVNNTICDNTGGYGGGVFLENFSGPSFLNNIVYYNYSQIEGDQIYNQGNCFSSFVNCNIQGGKDKIGVRHGEEFNGTYQFIVKELPGFVNKDTGNYQLITGSSCIDKGLNPGGNNVFFDLNNMHRISDGLGNGIKTIDIGAYEYGAIPRLDVNISKQNESYYGYADGQIMLNIKNGIGPYSLVLKDINNHTVNSKLNVNDSVYVFDNLEKGIYYVEVSDEIGDKKIQTCEIELLNEIEYSISGRITCQNNKNFEGVVIAYKYYDETIVPTYIETVNNSKYFIPNVDSGKYLVQAIPLRGVEIYPTYYFNTIEWQDAEVVHVFGNAFDVNIYIETEKFLNPDGQGIIIGKVIYQNTKYENTVFSSSKFEDNSMIEIETLDNPAKNIPVILKNSFGKINWALSDRNGMFYFNNLPDGDYELSTQYPGKEIEGRRKFTISANNLKQDSLILIIRKDDIIISSPFTALNPQVKVYPNPVINHLTINIEEYRAINYGVYIYNVQGKLIYELNTTKGIGLYETVVDLKNLPVGTYWLRLKTKNENKVFPFIKL